MRFEFHLNSGKKAKKRNKTKPKLSKLFKKKESHYEIVKGTPIGTDMFGRTIYQNINGVFRAVGDEYPLYANVEQRENELISLAPPREEDEEDTRRPEKPAEDIGTWIIIPPPKYLWDICYLTGYDYKIAVLRLPLIPEQIKFEVIFDGNDPKYEEEYGDKFRDMYISQTFGFFNKTAFFTGYPDPPGRPCLYTIDYQGNFIKSREDLELAQSGLYYSDASYTIYNGKFYFAKYSSNILKVYNMDENLSITLVNEIKTDGIPTYPRSIYLWKNFAVFKQTNNKVKIYDFIKDRLIDTIDIPAELTFRLADFNDDTACFIVSQGNIEYVSPGTILPEQHCIALTKTGGITDITAEGTSMYAAVDKEKLVFYSYIPYENMGDLHLYGWWNSFATHNDYAFLLDTNILYQSSDGKHFSFLYNLSTLGGGGAKYLHFTPDGHLLAIGDNIIYRAKDETYQEWDVISLPDTTYFDAKYPIQFPMVVSSGSSIFIRTRYGLMISLDNGFTWAHKSSPADFTLFLGGGTMVNFNKQSMGYYSYLGWVFVLENIPSVSFDGGNTWGECSVNDESIICRFDNTHRGGCWWNRGNCPLGSHRCLFVPEYNPPEDCQGYEDGCPWGLTGREPTPDTYCYGTVYKGWVAQSRDSLNTVYMATTYGILKSTDGVLFHYYMDNPPPGYRIKDFYDKNGIVLMSVEINEECGGLYSGNSLISTQEGGYLNNLCVFGDIILAAFQSIQQGYTSKPVYSDDGGITWKDIELIHEEPEIISKINIYHKSGDSFIFSKEYEIEDFFVYPMQGEIGGGCAAGLYKNKFYFLQYIFNLSNGSLYNKNISTYSNLFLDRFHFYYCYPPEENWERTFYVEDLETGKKYKLIGENEYPNISPIFRSEHKANYYLR
ncbi:MAG: hypothetical protein WC181_07880 [Defluviitoga sp.]